MSQQFDSTIDPFASVTCADISKQSLLSQLNERALFFVSPINKKFADAVKFNKESQTNPSIEYFDKEFCQNVLKIDNGEELMSRLLKHCITKDIETKGDSLWPKACNYSGSTAFPNGTIAYVGTMGDGRVVNVGIIGNNEFQIKGIGQTVLCENGKDGKLSKSEFEKEIECLKILKSNNIPSYGIAIALKLDPSQNIWTKRKKNIPKNENEEKEKHKQRAKEQEKESDGKTENKENNDKDEENQTEKSSNTTDDTAPKTKETENVTRKTKVKGKEKGKPKKQRQRIRLPKKVVVKEECYIVVRYFASWFRVGTFEHLYYQNCPKTIWFIIQHLINCYILKECKMSLLAKKVNINSGDEKNADNESKTNSDITSNSYGYSDYRLKDWMIKYIRIKQDDCEQDESIINKNIQDITKMSLSEELSFGNDIIKNIFVFFECIVKLNARLISYWMFEGFIHGMLRTDNINILGVTIDLGSFMFIDKIKDKFDENTNPHSRIEMYSFKNQISTMAVAMTRIAISLSLILNYKKMNILNEMNQLLAKYYIYLRIEYLQRVKDTYFKDLKVNDAIGAKNVNDNDNSDKNKNIDDYLKNETSFNDWDGVVTFENLLSDETKWTKEMKIDQRCIWCLEYTSLMQKK